MRRLFIEPRSQCIKQWQAVLLAQPVCVVDARFALRRIGFGQRLDLIQRLEVIQCLRCAPGFLHALEGVHKGALRVRETAEVRWTFETASSSTAGALTQVFYYRARLVASSILLPVRRLAGATYDEAAQHDNKTGIDRGSRRAVPPF